MALKVTKTDTWMVQIDDRAGGAADKIEPLSRAGANFEFVFCRRTPEHPGKGLLMVTPVKGSKVMRAATAVGFSRSLEIEALRIEGASKPGIVAKMMRALAEGGISFRGFTATDFSRKFVAHVALDSAADSAKASALLRRLG